jgi:hypothetical protein
MDLLRCKQADPLRKSGVGFFYAPFQGKLALCGAKRKKWQKRRL